MTAKIMTAKIRGLQLGKGKQKAFISPHNILFFNLHSGNKNVTIITIL